MKTYNAKVVHSTSATAWNVINSVLGAKRKLAVVYYPTSEDPTVQMEVKLEALKDAEFIAHCFNNFPHLMGQQKEK